MDEKMRKRIELAARAVGASQFPESGPWEYFFVRTPDRDSGDGMDFIEWKPWEDDADAWRLAVSLGMLVDIDFGRKVVDVSLRLDEGKRIGSFQVAIEEDPSKAARHAVVYAAAFYQESKNRLADGR